MVACLSFFYYFEFSCLFSFVFSKEKASWRTKTPCKRYNEVLILNLTTGRFSIYDITPIGNTYKVSTHEVG